MNIVGLLAWWDESPAWLASCVAGFGRVCDTIIAVDGSYALLPGGRARSHPDQAQAILDASEAAQVGCLIHRPKDIWFGNEIEKRQMTVELARPLQPDWLVVFDADWLMMMCDPAAVRNTLERSDRNVATVTILDNEDVLADWKAPHARRKQISTERTTRIRSVFRWTDDLTYGPAHWCVRGTYDGQEQWLRGPNLVQGQQHLAAPTEHLGRHLVAVHRNQKRAKVRTMAAEGYYKMRDAAAAEQIPVFA